jgi:hypothetical protein
MAIERYLSYVNLALELMPSALVVLGLAMAYLIMIYAIIRFIEESGDLRSRLFQLESELAELKGMFPGKRRRNARLKQSLPPIRKHYKQLCDYYAQLREIEIDKEKADMDHELHGGREILVREFV